MTMTLTMTAMAMAAAVDVKRHRGQQTADVGQHQSALLPRVDQFHAIGAVLRMARQDRREELYEPIPLQVDLVGWTDPDSQK